MPVLVDSSVWIDYFRSGENATRLDWLIDENLIVINDIILAELVPFLRLKNQTNIIRLLNALEKLPLRIEWAEIIEFQVKCLEAGLNGLGIPDLLIAQNVRQSGCQIYSLDKHFRLVSQIIDIDVLETEP
ncbi:MAG: PIN domain-containing protein [Chloroflexi bacterium]|nr:PIN domain-containing protein [Chloroflexota bacterium]MBP7042843.1 PIN domain-containing protein [Chloroflexota bacterium]